MTDRAPIAGAPRGLLVARAQSGDRDALDQLLRAMQAPLYAHARAIVRDDDEAKDVLQDAFLLLCRGLPALRDPRWFRAWAYRIVTREAVRRSRGSSRWTSLTPDDEPATDEVVDTALDDVLLARLPALLDALPPASRVVLQMRYVDDLSHAEIAEALELAPGTVKSRLAYGLAALRRKLGVVGAQ